MKGPLVTVLMPVYNAEKFVAAAIQSILDQTFPDFELLVIDDGSTDNSAAIIKSFRDDRIVYTKNETNLKLITTLNKGLELANGKYIVRLDADDLATETRIQDQVEFMEANPKVGLSGTWYEAFGSVSSIGKNPISNAEIRYMSFYQCPIIHPSTIFRTSVIRENNLRYNMGFPHAEDYELWGQFAEVSELANIPKALLKYRVHENNISKLQNETQKYNSYRIKKQLFQKVGVTASDHDLDLFQKMNHQVNILKLTELDRLGVLISKMLEGNVESQYLDQAWFADLLRKKWFETCENHSYYGFSVWKLYWKYQSIRFGLNQLKGTFKLFIKSILGHLKTVQTKINKG